MAEYNPFSLKDKRILVTGASGGIGKAIAVECSKMGANVIITARNTSRLDTALSEMTGNFHSALTADLSRAEDIDKIAETVPALDGIVHCAGIGDRTLGKMVREKDIRRVMSINFDAQVLLQRALLKKKKISPDSSIIFISSRAPFAPTIGNGLYAASKAAIIAFARTLALELAPQNIRVNCICPAMVWTDLIERDAAITGADYHEAEKSYPLGRYGQPEDIAYLAVYLLSGCSRWMTGSAIDITGGAHSL